MSQSRVTIAQQPYLRIVHTRKLEEGLICRFMTRTIGGPSLGGNWLPQGARSVALRVTGLPRFINTYDLYKIFEENGNVSCIDIRRSQGFSDLQAFLTFT